MAKVQTKRSGRAAVAKRTSVAHAASANGSAIVHDLGAKISQMARDGRDALRATAGDYVELGKAKVRDLEHAAETRIQDRPLKAVCIAAAVGFVVGLIIRRR